MTMCKQLARIHPVILWMTVLGIGLLSGDSVAEEDPIKKALDDSSRHHEWIEIEFGDESKLEGSLVFPEVKGEADIVIVIHENRGLTDWVRLVGDKVAAEGFVAFCPDFLSGKGPEGGGTASFPSSDDARRAIYELDADSITAGLEAAIKHLRGLPSTTDKVSVIGFCWGGGQAFRCATNDSSLAAAFVFYGRPPQEGYERIECPVYGFYGENDNRINATIGETQEKMKSLEKEYEPVVYDGVGHAFLRAGMAPDADEAGKKAVTASWDRFMSHLK